MRRSRMLNMATVQENHDRFLRRAVEFQSVWTVWGNPGPLVVEADGNEVAPRDVYLFFSDEAYARRALRESWPDCPTYATRSISLFDLLYRWLPGMQRDRHLAGTNWTGDLIGLELEPSDLRSQLHERLPQDLRARFREMLESSK